MINQVSEQLKEIQEQLSAKSAGTNKDFFTKMVPGQQRIYGVKTPELNTISRKYQEYSFALSEELWNSGALEERIIAIKIMERTG